MREKTTWQRLAQQTGISIVILKARDLTKKVERAKGAARAIQI